MMAPKSQNQESIAHTAAFPIRLAFRWMMRAFLLAVLAMGIAIAWGRYFYGDNRIDWISDLTHNCLQYLSDPTVAKQLADLAYSFFFKLSMVESAMIKIHNGETTFNIMEMLHTRIIYGFHDDLIVAMYAVRLFAIKLAIFVLAWPLFLLICGLGFADGMVERSIRKACGGLESATRYHLAKHYAFKWFPSGVAFFYLCLPIDAPLHWFFPVIAVITAFLLRTQAKYFKKYL